MAKGEKFSAKMDKGRIEELLLDDMARDCMRLVKEAIETSTFTSRTRNLISSYGAAVYKDGVFKERTLATIDFSPTKPKSWYGELISGQEAMMNYFRTYKPRTKGYTIVLVAAMPYATVLEKGSAGLHYKYKVISGAYSLQHELAAKYSGKSNYKQYKWAKGVRTTISKID